MKGVLLSIMFYFKSLAFHPLLNLDLDRTGDFSTDGLTNLLVPNNSCVFRLFQDIGGNFKLTSSL